MILPDAVVHVVRTTRARLETGFAFSAVAGQAFVDPTAVDAVGGGELRHRTTRPYVLLDDKAPQVHRRPPSFGVSDVLTHQQPELSLMS